MTPLILLSFIFLAVVMILAWCGLRRLSMWLFMLFLIASVLVLWHHMTDALPLNF